MKTEHFRAVLQEGHKGLALEIPFDPTHRWGTPSVRLEPGRHGHPVHGRLQGTPFQSAIVARGGGYVLLVDSKLAAEAGVEPGREIEVILHPGAGPGGPATGSATRPPRRRSTERA